MRTRHCGRDLSRIFAALALFLTMGHVMGEGTAQAQNQRIWPCVLSAPACASGLTMRAVCLTRAICADGSGRLVRGCIRYGCERLPPVGERPPHDQRVVPRRVRCAAAPACGQGRTAICVSRGVCQSGPRSDQGCLSYACIPKL